MYQSLRYDTEFIKSIMRTTHIQEIRSLIIDHDGKNRLLSGSDSNKCIDRKKFEDYLLKFFEFFNFGIDKETIIIFGSMTSIGKWFINHYKRNGSYSLLLIRGIFDFDFKNPTTTKLLSKLKIKRMIICYAPDFETFQDVQNMKKLNHKVFSSIAKTVKELSIKTWFFAFPPFFDEKYSCFSQSLVIIFILPYIVTNESISLTNILDQKILRKFLNKSKFKTNFGELDDYYLLACSYDSIIPALIKYKAETKFVIIESKNMLKLSNFLMFKQNETNGYNYEFVNKLSNTSKYEFDSNDHINIQYNEDFVRKMAIYEQYKSDYCYLDFMIAARNDNYGKDMYHRIGVFIQSLNDGLEMFPSAKAELHIVDYNSPNDNSLYRDIGFPKTILNATKTTIVSHKQHEYINQHIGGKIKIYEYIAKNIGMTYSKAEYILNTNLDEIFPLLMFEVIALQHFNPNYLYKARRIDQGDYIYYGTDRYKHLFDKVDPDFISYRKIQYNLFENVPFDAPGDFQMASKEYFNLMHGFPEYPQNWGFDSVLIWLTARFITHGIEFETGIDFFHQFHTRPKKITDGFYFDFEKQLKCRGFTDAHNFKYYNGPNWGFKNLSFKHFKIKEML